MGAFLVGPVVFLAAPPALPFALRDCGRLLVREPLVARGRLPALEPLLDARRDFRCFPLAAAARELPLLVAAFGVAGGLAFRAAAGFCAGGLRRRVAV